MMTANQRRRQLVPRLRSRATVGSIAALLITAAILALGLSRMGSQHSPEPASNGSPVALLASSVSTTSATSPPVAGILSNGDGWALTTIGLELTTDGGQSFKHVQTPTLYSRIQGVAWNGSNLVIAWVTGGQVDVAYSPDQGATWVTEPSLPTQIPAGSIDLVTQNGLPIGMLVTEESSSNFSYGAWFKTTDNGRTWSEYSAPSGGTVTIAGGSLWLVGGPTSGLLFQSSDNGTSWSRAVLPLTVSATQSAISIGGALGSGAVVLVAAAPSTVSNTVVLTAFSSSDSRNSWVDLAQWSYPGSIGVGVTAPAAVGNGSIWVGEPAGGAVWILKIDGTTGMPSSQAAPALPSNGVSSVATTGTSGGWATTASGVCTSGKTSCTQSGNLFATADDGTTWRTVNLSASAT